MPKYPCPACDAVLKREMPVPSGKKIRCPKCDFAFTAVNDEDDEPVKKKAKPAPKKEADAPKKKVKAAPKPSDDEDDEEVGGTYGLNTTEEEAEAKDPKKKKKKDVEYGSLRDKYEKSKRGPAMAKTVKPSNLILLQGVINCITSLVTFVIGLWPFIFSAATPRGGEATNQILIMVGGVLGFGVGCLICYGASKMQDLESHQWAMVGSILAIISVLPTGLIGGLMGIKVLKEEDVIEGFEETIDGPRLLKSRHRSISNLLWASASDRLIARPSTHLRNTA